MRGARSVALDAASLTVTAALAAFVWSGAAGPARVVLALLFAMFVPGRAVVTSWPEARRRSELALPVACSLALSTVLATVAVWVHQFHPIALFAAEAAASAAALVVALAQAAAGWRAGRAS